MASKRKHVTLTLKLKYEILEQLRKGVSGRLLAKKYGIGTSTVSDIKRHKNKLESFIAKCESGPGSRKTLKNGEYPKMEAELYCWVLQQRSTQVPISYDILAQQAKQLFQKCYGNSNFNASRGWITKFKKRHGMLKISGGKLTDGSNLVEPFRKKLCEQIKSNHLLPSQIYNVKLSTLFWKHLPTLPVKEVASEREKVMIMLCCNASGCNKLKPFVVGKLQTSKTFKNVEYKSTSNAVVTSAMFREWFHSSFTTQVRIFSETYNLSPSALLLVDNASDYLYEDLVSEDGNISTMLVSSLSTTVLSMCQDVITLTKLFYRKLFLSYILASKESDRIISLQKINLKSAMDFLSEAWQKISAETLSNCWNKLLDENWADDDDIPFSELEECLVWERTDMQNIADMLNKITGNASITEAEIKEWVEGDDTLVCEENEAEEEREQEYERQEEVQEEGRKVYVHIKREVEQEEEAALDDVQRLNSPIRNYEAAHCFSVCLKWAEENDIPFDDILVLRKVKEKAFLLSQNEMENGKLNNV